MPSNKRRLLPEMRAIGRDDWEKPAPAVPNFTSGSVDSAFPGAYPAGREYCMGFLNPLYKFPGF